MCGIAGLHIKPDYKGKIPAGRLLDWLLIGILPRGDHATGFLSVGFDNQIQLDKAPVDAKAFVKKRKSIKAEPQTVLAHTRYATQGDPSDNRNNHPVNYGTTFLVHNGWITNDDEIYKKYDMERHAEVDTEAIAAALWNQCAGDSWGDADKALEELEGAVAIAAVDIRRPGEVLLARGYNSPLVYIEAKQFFMWASTLSALKLAWGKVFGTPPADDKFKSLQEGEIMVLRNGEPSVGSFAPAWGTRYTNSSYGYAWADDDYGYSGSTSGTEGYWVTNADGSRTYKSYTPRLTDGRKREIREQLAFSTPYSRGVAMGNMTPWTPIQSELDVAETYLDWARMDMEINEQVVSALSELVDLDYDLIHWLLFMVEPEALENNKKLVAVRDFLDKKYQEFYDRIMEDFMVDEDKQIESANAAGETIMAEILRNATSQEDAEKKVAEATRPFPSFDPMYACIECGQYEMEDSGYCMECEVKREVRQKVG